MIGIKGISFFLVLFTILGCNSKEENNIKEEQYFKHIGDTKFDSSKDNVNFKFCDSTKVFHSRSRVSYENGHKGLQNEIIERYNYQISFNNFTGYFFIRLAVNCNNEAGRFRWEIVDENHQETTCSKTLENHIIQVVKSLKNWNAVTYEGESYDGYTFFIIKFKDGKIIDL